MSKSYGLGTGWISPGAASRCRSGGFPLRFSPFDALPRIVAPDSHLVRTAIPNMPRGQVLTNGQPRRFPLQSDRSLSLFCRIYFKEQYRKALWPQCRSRVNPLSAYSTQGRLLCTQLSARLRAVLHRIAGLTLFRTLPRVPSVWISAKHIEQASTAAGS